MNNEGIGYMGSNKGASLLITKKTYINNSLFSGFYIVGNFIGVLNWIIILRLHSQLIIR